jgi:alginate O-acetyltransferase complex protein AlgI
MELSFSSLAYLVFFGVCVLALSRSKSVSAQRGLLIIFSCLFYASFGITGVIAVSLIGLADYYVARHLSSSLSTVARKRWLWVGITANLGPLAFIKYTAFLTGVVASSLHPIGVRLPIAADPALRIIGLSYIAFSGMGYLLDVYYDTIAPTQSLSGFIAYLLYFPKLVAGPIVRMNDSLPQFEQRLRFTSEDFETGCAYFLAGAVKKLVIADQLAPHVGMILASPQHYNALTLAQGMIGYTVQIYADFSGYSDMAIGCARIMGIRLPQNFLMPYSSVNIAEFWRRWHVTMSAWFRDYLFLPLEMGSREMRNPALRGARNMLITMLLCGLWHGASWNFVLWGGFHGMALAAYQLYSRLTSRHPHRRTRSIFHPYTLAARGLTLSVVIVSWIFFGTPTLRAAFTFLWRLFTWTGDGISLGSSYIMPLALLVFVVHLFINKDRNVIEELPTLSMPARVVTYSCLLLAITSLVPSEAVPFVYVHF